jgi:serine protease
MFKHLLALAFSAIFLHSFAQERIRGEFIAQIKKNTTAQQAVQELNQAFGIQPEFKIIGELSDVMRIYHFAFNEDFVPVSEIIRFAPTSSTMTQAQINRRMQNRLTPNDPSYSQQWFHVDPQDNDIDSDLAWDITTGGFTALGDEIVVCVVEGGGAKWDHPDLIDNHWTNNNEIAGNGIDDDGNGYVDDVDGWNISNTTDNLSTGNHGTQVSSMIGAKGDNGVGITGVNWNVKIMQVQMGSVSEANAIAAYNYPLKMRKMYNQSNGASGAFVVATNSSWGIDNGQPSSAPLWCAMYDSLGYYGVLSCGSTANNNVNVDVVGDLPTACPSEFMVAVTATNNSDVRTFSGYGVVNIDIAAPGENVYLAGNNSYGNTSGTSFAGPCVAGGIALLYSAPCSSIAAIAHADPQLGAQMVRDYIYNGVDLVSNLSNEVATGGRLNVNNSLNLLLNECSTGGCIAPFSLNATQTPGTTTYTLSWSALDGTTGFNLQYRPTGTPTWTIIENVTNANYTLENMLACTEYEFQVASICDVALSDWTSSYLFETDGCCVNPSNYILSNVSPVSASLSWENILAADGYSLILTWPGGQSQLAVPSNNFNFSDLDSCTTYTVSVFSSCLNPEVNPTEFIFSTTGCGSCTDIQYCEANGGSVTDEWIENVTLGSFSNTSAVNAVYSDYTDLNVGTFQAGQTYSISLTPGFSGFSYNEYFKVWIDYNGNGTFDEPLELAFDGGGATTATETGTITIPTGCIEGSTRLRVGMAYVGTFGNGTPPAACGAYSYGEVEDYCVTLDPTVSITEYNSNTFGVFPNPAEDHLQLNFNGAIESVEIVNAIGQTVLAASNTKSIAIQDLTPGWYAVRLKSNSNLFIAPFWKR